ncbi:MAG: PLP-dependent transferase [Bacteroidota bacterium]
MKDSTHDLNAASWLVNAGRKKEAGQSLNIPPILASNFILGGSNEYSRNEGTSAWSALEEIVGGMEHGKAVVFSSGMAAVSAVFDQIKTGSIVVIPDDCYQGVASIAAQGQEKGIWKVEKVAVSDTEGWLKALEYADLIWLESPSNPLLEISDLKTICAAKRKPGSILGVDNTFATSINQQPLDLGADVSVQSVTKYIGGHSDLLSGIVCTNDDRMFDALQQTRALLGATPGAMEVFLATRGVRTMHLRLERAQQNAIEIAKRLEQHPGVSKVRYPGLASHPSHALAKEQLRGFGTIISFDLVGDATTADSVCKDVRLIQHATSLGAVESTMERRGAVAGQEQLPPTLLRLSVGVEDVDDLWNDLDQAIKRNIF